MNKKPYRITSERLPGLAKLVEEAGEVIKDAAKIMGGCADPGAMEHLEDEIGDLYAALYFFTTENPVNNGRIGSRSIEKLKRWTDKRIAVRDGSRS